MIRKVRQIYRQKVVLFKMVLSYVMLGSLLISVFAFVLVNRVTDDLTAEIREHSEEKIYQSYSTADILLMNAYRSYYQEFNNDEMLSDALYGKNLDRIKIGRISAKLNEMLGNNPLVYSIYVYNFQDDLVFSTLDNSKPIHEFYDEIMTYMVQHEYANRGGYLLPRSENFTINDKSYDKNIISMIYVNSDYNSYSYGALVVNLDQQVFQQLVTKGDTDTLSKVMIIDQDGTIISHPNGNLLNTNIFYREPYIQTILGEKAEKGHFMDSADGKKSLITFVKSDRLGWSFVGVSEYEGLIGRAQLLKRFIFAISAVFALLGLIAAGFFTSLFYRPISRLIKRVRSHPEGALKGEPISEYELISRSFDSLENLVDRLQSDLKLHLPQTQKALLLSMLSGEWREDPDTDHKLKQAGVSLKEGALQVCVIRLDHYFNLMKQYGSRDTLLLKYAISNITEEIVKEHMQAETFEDAEDSLTVILSGSEANPFAEPDQAEKLANEILRQIQNYLKLSVTVGIGTKVELFGQIKHSYNKASQAANYRLLHGSGNVLGYENIHRKMIRTYEYPLHFERKIVDYLKVGDLPRLYEAFEEFSRHICEFTYDEIFLSLNQLMVITLRTAIEMIDEPSEEWMMDLQDAHHKLRQHDTIEEIRDWYVLLCGRIIDIRDQKSASQTDEQVAKLRELIERQYEDPNLSVASLAESVGLSTNYARKVFKEHTGQSISNYMNEYRFRKAQELLTETDFPANRISEMVGMSNPSYFYVSFKKFVGKTPDHYRKTHRLAE